MRLPIGVRYFFLLVTMLFNPAYHKKIKKRIVSFINIAIWSVVLDEGSKFLFFAAFFAREAL